MKCPECGTNGIEGGVCFYCEARKERQRKRGDAEQPAGPEGPARPEEPPAEAPPTEESPA